MSKFFKTINFILLPLLLAASWQFLSANKLVNAYLIPAPTKVLAAAAALLKSGALYKHLSISLFRVFAGFGISVCAALPVAFIFYFSSIQKRFFYAIFEFIRAVPPLAMIPLLILWFGLGEASKLAVIVLATFFPVFLNAESGLESVEERWLELAQSLELSFAGKLKHILIPGAMPQIVTGLRLGFGYAWRALLGAELFAAASGIGYLITDAQQMARIDIVFVGIISIGILGLLFDNILHLITSRVMRNSENKD
ncbi:ABC transporter permease [Spirochaetia bacterium]|nr:ABC transporter permease [Spirochaetia bacterium]